MKKILIILLVIFSFSNTLFACSCKIQEIIDRYTNSDFIATVEILDIDENSDQNYIKLNIKPSKIFKGIDTKSLKIKKTKYLSGVIYTPIKTKWLIFASKDKNDNLTFNKCSAIQLDQNFDGITNTNYKENYKNSIQNKLRILNDLSNLNLKIENKFDISTFLEKEFLKFKNYELIKNQNAFYQISISKNLDILNIKPLKEFDNKKFSKKILKVLKKNLKIDKTNQNSISEETKIVIGLYYYPAKIENEIRILPQMF